jgi:hypothetical protein
MTVRSSLPTTRELIFLPLTDCAQKKAKYLLASAFSPALSAASPAAIDR